MHHHPRGIDVAGVHPATEGARVVAVDLHVHQDERAAGQTAAALVDRAFEVARQASRLGGGLDAAGAGGRIGGEDRRLALDGQKPLGAR